MLDLSLNIDGIERKIHFKQSQKARKMILRDKLPDYFEVIIPPNGSLNEARNFFQDNFEWICSRSRKSKISNYFILEKETISLLGQEYRLEKKAQMRGIIKIEQNTLYVPIASEHSLSALKLKFFLINKLKNYIKSLAKEYASKINTKFLEVKIRQQETRWGSCSSNKTLCFNLNLIFAPKEILDYVIAHEVAHLQEMNHSKKFWNLVKSINPDYQACRAWLKINGNELRAIKI
jgi:predicted metal-dependent hydrolase